MCWFLGVILVSGKYTLQWRHRERDGVSNHRRLDYLINRLFRRRWKKTSKLRVTGFCEANSPRNGEFPTQRASDAENVSIWWRHHGAMVSVCASIASLALEHLVLVEGTKMIMAIISWGSTGTDNMTTGKRKQNITKSCVYARGCAVYSIMNSENYGFHFQSHFV